MLPRSAKPVGFLMVLLAAVASVPVWGQSWAGRGRLQGQIKDEQGNPVEGATITFRKGTDRVDPKADGPKPITTDRNGKWSILGLAEGAWGMLIQKPGFMESEGQIKVDEFHVAQPTNITLKKPSQEQLQAAQAQQAPSAGALAKAAIEKANALLAQGKYAEARASYEEGMSKLEDKSLHPAIYRAIADSYYKEGK